ncbi:ACP S-malonyltransferase [Streptomyces naphthomycinicus]|uniref:ACP S-malonyltransferase n=1 Tax=Streptomyces naphthomycinicus TaxID=2872625 RepID=UPI001CEC2D59|nr:ACP S-malonyltransferase [Streptomyces sp. TML10]
MSAAETPLGRVLSRRPYAALFPGAGTQRPGMAARLLARSPAARELLARLEAACDAPLRDVCVDGTPRQLRAVGLAYPAVFVTGLLAFAALVEHQGAAWRPPALAGGHSLGHFTALVCAGALTAEEALGFVRERSRLMEAESARRPGGMLSVVGAGHDRVTRMCAQCPAELGVLTVGCRNGTRHLVVSGDRAAVHWLRERADALGARKVTDVRTGLAAHSSLMAPVRDRLRTLARRLPVSRPAVPVLSNLTGRPLTDAREIHAELGDQVAAQVRWDLCLDSVAAHGVHTVLDLGPGQAMASLARSHGLRAAAVNSMEPLPAVLAAPAPPAEEVVR